MKTFLRCFWGAIYGFVLSYLVFVQLNWFDDHAVIIVFASMGIVGISLILGYYTTKIFFDD